MNKQESKYTATASLMDEALLLLLEKKELAAITVKELCEKAGVNRTTFYLHYENMHDLLEETIEMINKKFLDSLSNVSGINHKKEVLTNEKYLKPYLNLIKENRRAYRVIHQKGNLFNIQKTFNVLYETIFSPALSNFKVSEKEKKYVLAFYTQGTMAIIGQWLDGNCEDYVDMVMDLIMRHTQAYENNR